MSRRILLIACGLSVVASVAVACSSNSSSGAAPQGETVDAQDVLLDDGQIAIPSQDVGDTDLAALPLGDDRISSAPEVGKLWSCIQDTNDPGGAIGEAPWIDGDTWSMLNKVWVEGDVAWPGEFEVSVQGDTRVLTTNDLPGDHTTGIYPIQQSDPAYVVDRNPNSIAAQSFSFELPASPTEAAEASCATGEVAILLSGVVVFNAFDAGLRDAVAHETQDHCQGHPQESGVYHYHSLSTCVEDTDDPSGHSDLLGYAFDGFGFYGHRGENGEVLASADLDECHGHTHEIEWEGQTVEMYHYHATWDFPYTIGCFRATPAVSAGLGGTPPGGTRP